MPGLGALASAARRQRMQVCLASLYSDRLVPKSVFMCFHSDFRDTFGDRLREGRVLGQGSSPTFATKV